VELEDALVAPGPPAEICRSVKMKGNSYPLATKQEPYAVDQQPPRRMRTGPGSLRRALWGDGEWWSEETEKSVSKGAVQAPFETLLGGIHSTELVRRASSRDMRVSRREEDYGGGRRVKVGWMKLPQIVKLNMHRRETRSLKSRRGAFLRQSSTFFDSGPKANKTPHIEILEKIWCVRLRGWFRCVIAELPLLWPVS
jgi:hypothetical protein